MPRAPEHRLLAVRTGRLPDGKVRVRLLMRVDPLPVPHKGVLRLPIQVRHASRRTLHLVAIGLASKGSDTILLCELALLPGAYRLALGDPPVLKRIWVRTRGPVRYGCAHAGIKPTTMEARALSEPDGSLLASTARFDLSPCCRERMLALEASMPRLQGLTLLRPTDKSILFLADGKTLRIRPGQYVLADPKMKLSHHPDQPFGFAYFTLDIKQGGLERLAEEVGLPQGPRAFSFSMAPRREPPELTAMIRALEEALDNQEEGPGKTYLARLVYQQLLLHLLGNHPPRPGHALLAPDPRDADPRVSVAVRHIETRYAGACLIPEIADAAGTSVSLLGALFRKHLGSSPKDVLQRVRVEKAKALLRDRRNSLEDVAAAVGYQDVRSFRRVFKAHTLAQVRAFRGG